MKQTRRRFKQLMAALLAVILLYAPVLPSCAGSGYPTTDMFAGSDSIKGMQGAVRGTQDSFGGLQHSLANIFLDQCIYYPEHPLVKSGAIAPYEFEGDTFYFSFSPASIGFVPNCNGSGMSISIVFLMRWNGQAESAFMIDENSRVSGHNFYAPATTGYGGKCMRAFWNFWMENLAEEGWHIDNFILGNEVNMHNQWHYSGGGDAQTVAYKYADAFYDMYSAVRKYTSVSRCSVSVDHSWQNDDEGRGISVRNFLHLFNDRLASKGDNVDWCISTHLYPAMLYNTRIWEEPHGLNPVSSDARIIDGRNLSVMTSYIRDNFGEQHRIMLTEQGFTDECGREAQAACLAYTYYAAMYDPMVDSFLISTENAGIADTGEGLKSLNFNIRGTLAEEVYTRIDSGNPADAEWIAQTCLPVIGVGSWNEIIPNFGAFTRGRSGFFVENGRGCYYRSGEIDTSYSRWYYDGDKYYLLQNGREIDIPDTLSGDYTGWYRGTDGKGYWAENGVQQGFDPGSPFYRGKEIYDPLTDAWYWLDNVQGGAMTVNKDVYQESDAGPWAEGENGTGKWVHYDENGRMVKGWSGNYYFDLIYGTMAKGTVEIDGRTYTFDQVTGILVR